ncbi:hypothetical protein DPMN_027366 [Dreissena polymorpha]|uniref:Uncharacterized protein n=1 Tax=Dreissena polymorpha TaxID=45954 RepID=A0A9D4LV28_DREPO|nr:hypothetical protein DPMN_027366 [Dreissena polymorpha]
MSFLSLTRNCRIVAFRKWLSTQYSKDGGQEQENKNRGVEEIKTMFKNSKNSEKMALANSVEPDETPHDAASHLGTFEKENRPPKEGQPSSSTATCSVQKYSPPAAWHIERECTFHDDWAKIVTYRVKLRQPPPLPAIFFNHHVIKTNILTNCKLDQRIIRTNLLTKFHEDRTRNVAYRVFSNQMWTTDDGQRPITKAHLRNQCRTDGRMDGQPDGRTDNAKTISLRLWRGIIIYCVLLSCRQEINEETEG